MTIHEAINTGDLDALRTLIAGGADVNGRDTRGRPSLHVAAARGDLDACLALLDAGADVEARALGPEPDPPLTAPSFGATAFAGLFGDPEATPAPDHSEPPGDTPLATAAAAGHASVVRLLLDRGADPNARGRDGSTALTLAVAGGHREAMEALLERGADTEATDQDGLTPLMLAARDGRLGFVRSLLEAGAHPNAASQRGTSVRTSLGLATGNRHHAVAEALIAAGAMGSHTPLQLGYALADAVEKNRIDLARSLIAAGAEVNPRLGRTDLLHAAAQRGHVEVIRLLIEAGARLEARSSFWGTTPLLVAAEHGQEAAVATLVAAGANVHAPLVREEKLLPSPLDGATALVLAATAGHAGVVRLLLDAGADRRATDADGRTAAQLAAAGGHDAVLEVLQELITGDVRNARLAGAAAAGDAARVSALLAEGATPDVCALLLKEHAPRPALALASARGHLAAVKALLAGGASVDLRSPGDRQTPLMLAAASGHADVVRALLAAGADSNARVAGTWRHAGRTPLIFAAEAGHLEAARALVEGDASVHVKDEPSLWDHESGPTGKTALAYAVTSDAPNLELVSLLLEAGAHPDPRDESGATPMIHVAFCGQAQVVRLLLDAGADPDSSAHAFDGQTALVSAALGDDPAIYRLLRDAGARPGPAHDFSEALDYAIVRGAREMAHTLLDDGVDVNTPSRSGFTPLATAAGAGQADVARKLLERGANPNAAPPGFDRPLHRAAVMGRAAVVRLLLDHGADPNAPGAAGLPPLLVLARDGGTRPLGDPSGLLDCARALLAAGAVADDWTHGRSALDFATERNSRELADLLRDAIRKTTERADG